jgi:hypothetical protein
MVLSFQRDKHIPTQLHWEVDTSVLFSDSTSGKTSEHHAKKLAQPDGLLP